MLFTHGYNITYVDSTTKINFRGSSTFNPHNIIVNTLGLFEILAVSNRVVKEIL